MLLGNAQGRAQGRKHVDGQVKPSMDGAENGISNPPNHGSRIAMEPEQWSCWLSKYPYTLGVYLAIKISIKLEYETEP